MEDKKVISIGKLAAMERARALGLPVRVPTVSAFEHQAREWKRQFEVRSPRPPRLTEPLARDGGQAKSEVQSPRSEVGSRKSEVQVEKHDQASSIKHPASSIKHPVSSMNEGFNWQPYESDQVKAERKPKNFNPASVSLMARKIMAREWANALGRGRGVEDDKSVIERNAEQFRQKKEAERERKEIEEKRANEQRGVLEKALRSFGRALLTASKPVTPETAEALLKEALSKVGDTIRITWEPESCNIFLEPWEEKRLRGESRGTVPALYQATIDNNFALSSFEKIQEPQVLEQAQNDLILKNILSSFRKSPQKDFHAFEDAVAERGRIIQSIKMNGGWKINFEPWQEMRIRNIERGGQPPIITYIIKTDKDFEHITCARGQ